MKFKSSNPLICCLFAGLLAAPIGANANSFVIDFTPSSTPLVEDAFYNDGESSVFLPEVYDKDGNLSSVLEARFYGRDYYDAGNPLSSTWGLLDNSYGVNQVLPGYLIRLGAAPSAVGSNVTGTGRPASYLVLSISRSADVTIDDIEIRIEDPEGADIINSWAGINLDGYSTPAELEILEMGSHRSRMYNFTNLNNTGTEPLEIRIYGFIGLDNGIFGIDGGINLPKVPEPASATLCLLGCLFALRRSRRR